MPGALRDGAPTDTGCSEGKWGCGGCTAAGPALAGIRRQLTSLLQAGGKEPVRAYLACEAETRLADRLNGWEGVTYRALAEDDAFCAGGWPR